MQFILLLLLDTFLYSFKVVLPVILAVVNNLVFVVCKTVFILLPSMDLEDEVNENY